MAQLDNITIEELCARARAKGLGMPTSRQQTDRVAV
jgi:hypothetical protein